MKHLVISLYLIFFSCRTIQHVSDKIEEPHYALYRQKVLLVQSVKTNKVYFSNPQGTRYYYLKGRRYTEQWAPGDTFVIDSNLVSFYNLRFVDKAE
jgi:hypothetical protein